MVFKSRNAGYWISQFVERRVVFHATEEHAAVRRIAPRCIARNTGSSGGSFLMVPGLPFEENVAQAKKAVGAIKTINPAILVEGEIGWIGSSSEILDKLPEGVGVPTIPQVAKQLVNDTRIDVLAPAVGNMHGLLQSMVHGEIEKRLDIQRIAEIKAATGIFVTLHGGSGTHDQDFQRAIKAGDNNCPRQHRIASRVAPRAESALQAHPVRSHPINSCRQWSGLSVRW